MASQSEQASVTDPTMTIGGRMMIDLHKSKSSGGFVRVCRVRVALLGSA